MDVKLVVIKGSKKTREVRLRGAEVVIGRQVGCGLRIPSATVSRRHCRLRLQGGEVTIEDLKSANGSFLNGARVTGPELVLPGDRLEIGPVAFLVEYQRVEQAEVTAPQAAARPAAPPPLPLPLPLPEAIPVPDDDFVEAIPIDDNPRKETIITPGARSVDEDVPLLFDDDDSWRLPEGQDLRDILSQADEP